MKARVKATNLIVEVEEYSKYLECGWKYRDINTGTLYKAGSLDFSAEAVVDYWERLEHQAAIGAMQAYIIASHISQFSFCEGDMKDCKTMAHALIQKLKEKEERK